MIETMDTPCESPPTRRSEPCWALHTPSNWGTPRTIYVPPFAIVKDHDPACVSSSSTTLASFPPSEVPTQYPSPDFLLPSSRLSSSPLPPAHLPPASSARAAAAAGGGGAVAGSTACGGHVAAPAHGGLRDLHQACLDHLNPDGCLLRTVTTGTSTSNGLHQVQLHDQLRDQQQDFPQQLQFQRTTSIGTTTAPPYNTSKRTSPSASPSPAHQSRTISIGCTVPPYYTSQDFDFLQRTTSAGTLASTALNNIGEGGLLAAPGGHAHLNFNDATSVDYSEPLQKLPSGTSSAYGGQHGDLLSCRSVTDDLDLQGRMDRGVAENQLQQSKADQAQLKMALRQECARSTEFARAQHQEQHQGNGVSMRSQFGTFRQNNHLEHNKQRPRISVPTSTTTRQPELQKRKWIKYHEQNVVANANRGRGAPWDTRMANQRLTDIMNLDGGKCASEQSNADLSRSLSLGLVMPRLRLRGLPFSVTEEDIVGFYRSHVGEDWFKGRVKLGYVEILIRPNDQRPSGQAYLYLSGGETDDAYQIQSLLQWRYMGNRYLEVFVEHPDR